MGFVFDIFFMCGGFLVGCFFSRLVVFCVVGCLGGFVVVVV